MGVLGTRLTSSNLSIEYRDTHTKVMIGEWEEWARKCNQDLVSTVKPTLKVVALTIAEREEQ